MKVICFQGRTIWEANGKPLVIRDGDEFTVAARGILVMIGCLAAAALLIITGSVYGLVLLARA